ncbi:hypothetical protein BKA66DRAFT_577346 [Pyrenochaeta sp. MPI-SDFR-AT-0127]|nr:hypothetical protein BKA66DRAFT_577346 [Pyrenochaeta sp. MPI-SDFR-AT-0127]
MKVIILLLMVVGLGVTIPVLERLKPTSSSHVSVHRNGHAQNGAVYFVKTNSSSSLFGGVDSTIKSHSDTSPDIKGIIESFDNSKAPGVKSDTETDTDSGTDTDSDTDSDDEPSNGPVEKPVDNSQDDDLYEFVTTIRYSILALDAEVPNDYEEIFQDRNATVDDRFSLYSRLILASYNPDQCATVCTQNTECKGFNIYVQRDPSCTDCSTPKTIEAFECSLHTREVKESLATNQGPTLNIAGTSFKKAVRGSNGYRKRANVKPVDTHTTVTVFSVSTSTEQIPTTSTITIQAATLSTVQVPTTTTETVELVSTSTVTSVSIEHQDHWSTYTSTLTSYSTTVTSTSVSIEHQDHTSTQTVPGPTVTSTLTSVSVEHQDHTTTLTVSGATVTVTEESNEAPTIINHIADPEEECEPTTVVVPRVVTATKYITRTAKPAQSQYWKDRRAEPTGGMRATQTVHITVIARPF